MAEVDGPTVDVHIGRLRTTRFLGSASVTRSGRRTARAMRSMTLMAC
jgi:hypothetical protein